jgi:predicted dehydrogenase
VSVAAVASRGEEKAAAFAKELGIPRAHGSYEALLADPGIDAIYLPLPNDLHAQWAIKAVQAGKHVLCEKPFAMNPLEAIAMYEAADAHKVHLVEAYPYMAQPQTLKLRELLTDGAIGRVQSVFATFTVPFCTVEGVAFKNPDDIRFDPARGGGALLDLGTYAMSLIRIVMGERPTRMTSLASHTPSGVDQTVTSLMHFPSGGTGQFNCSLSSAHYRQAIIIGESGIIETDYSNHAGHDTLTMRVKHGAGKDTLFDTITVPGTDGFLAEAESFVRMLRVAPQQWNGATRAESIDIAYALQAMRDSIATSGWVDVIDAN